MRTWRACQIEEHDKPAPRLPKTHDLRGVYRIKAEHSFDPECSRMRVLHWVEDLQSGDTIIWSPRDDAQSLAGYHVIATWPHYKRKGVSCAELGRIVPDATVSGETYRAPSQAWAMPVERFQTIRFDPA